MQNLDQQWRELQARYEQMSDEELQDLANEAYELTDMAKELLQGEIARRNLTEPPAVAGGAVRAIKLLTEPPAVAGGAVRPVAGGDVRPISADALPAIADDDDFDPEDLDLVKMDPVWDMDDARRVKGILDGYGVPSYYGPDNTEDVETLGSAFAAAEAEAARRGYEVGIDVKVPRRYRDQASRALANWAADQPPTDPDPTADADYAAQCPKCHSTEIVFEGRDGATPNPTDAKFRWHCETCGHTWSDEGVEEERRA